MTDFRRGLVDASSGLERSGLAERIRLDVGNSRVTSYWLMGLTGWNRMNSCSAGYGWWCFYHEDRCTENKHMFRIPMRGLFSTCTKNCSDWL